MINLGSHFFDQTDDITHTKNARGNSIRVKGLQRVCLLASTDELDRFASNDAHRQGCTATRITIGLGQHHASQWQSFAKGRRSIGCILPRHAIDNKQCFYRIYGAV